MAEAAIANSFTLAAAMKVVRISELGIVIIHRDSAGVALFRKEN